MISFVSGCRSYEYEGGRDTVAMLGNGKFQISESMNTYALFDADSPLPLVDGVNHWKESGQFAYIVGYDPRKKPQQQQKPSFFLIDLRSYEVGQYQTITQIPGKDRKIFTDMMKEKQPLPK